MKRVFLLFLILLLLPGCREAPSGPAYTEPFLLNQEQMRSRGHTEPAAGDSPSDHVLVYRNVDGSRTFYIGAAPWESFRDSLELLSEGGARSRGDGCTKRFPAQWSAAQGVEIGNSLNYLRLYPGEENTVLSMNPCTHTNLFGQQQQALLYTDAFGEGTDLYMIPTPFGVGTEIVLTKKPEASTFRLRIQVPPSYPDTGSPDYILFRDNHQEKVLSLLYTPLAGDAAGHWSYENRIELTDKDSLQGTYQVELTLDPEFLSAPTTRYPLTLHQSFALYTEKQPDTAAYSEAPEEARHYLSPYLLLGDGTCKGEGHAYIRFETLEDLAIAPEKIESASYTVRLLFDLPQEADLTLYPVTGDWCSINTRWKTRPEHDNRIVDRISVQKRGDYTLDVTDLIKEMLRNQNQSAADVTIRNGFLLRSDTGGANLLLASGDNGLFTPVLEIRVAA